MKKYKIHLYNNDSDIWLYHKANSKYEALKKVTEHDLSKTIEELQKEFTIQII